MAITVDTRFPAMDASSAVFPTIRTLGPDLALAYYLPGCEASAVVAFRNVSDWSYGEPNDEGLAFHPLWGRGLQPYEFHALQEDMQSGKTRWLGTFHDG